MQRICRVECAAICQIGDQWYEHEDEEVDWAFTYQDLDDLQDYDEGFDDADREELDLSEIESKLIFPRTSEHEPWLSSEEMSELDRLADEFELARLGGMKVLLPPDSEEVPPKAVRILRSFQRKWSGPGGRRPLWTRVQSNIDQFGCVGRGTWLGSSLG